MSETRMVRFDHLIGVYAVGSGDWSWLEEYDKLIGRKATRDLIESVRAEGIREPVLLGSDGRVWDGHHRIVAAMHLGLDSVPVEFSGASVLAEQGEPEWEYGQSEVLEDGTIAFGAPVETLEEAIRRRDIDRVNYPWPQELGVGRRRKAGPWEPVEENTPHTEGNER